MYLKAPINDFYLPEIKIEEGRCEIRMEVKSGFFHAADAVHGSCIFKLLDDAAFFAVQSVVESNFILTHKFETTFKKPVKQGVIIGKGRFEISEGRDFFGVSEVRNSEGELIALGRGSFRVSNWALSSVAGYQS
jgi:uncharacterized protein (TIGR00369 family)